MTSRTAPESGAKILSCPSYPQYWLQGSSHTPLTHSQIKDRLPHDLHLMGVSDQTENNVNEAVVTLNMFSNGDMGQHGPGLRP